jgi:hypothetical protein
VANLIDWYVVELKLLLHEKMPFGKVEKIVMEAEAHLRESVACKVAEGMPEAIAAASAVEAYGRPERVAMGFLRGLPQKLWGLNPVVWAGAGCLLTIYAWNFHWLTLSGPFDNFGESWQNGLAGFVGLLGLILTATAVRAGLRPYRLALSGFTLAATLIAMPLMSFWIIQTPGNFEGISRLHLSRDLPKVEHALTVMSSYEDYLKQGLREYASAKSPTDLSPGLRNPALAATRFGEPTLYPAVLGVTLDHGGSYVVPRQFGAYFGVRGGASVLETMAEFADAKKHWAEFGPKDLTDVKEQHRSFEALLANARSARAGKLFFPNPDMWISTTFATLFLWPFFLLVDWFAYRTAQPKRRWSLQVVA